MHARGLAIRALIAGVLLGGPAFGQSAVFDRATRLYGTLDAENPNTCARNPHHLSFDASGMTARFEWDTPVEGYDQSRRTSVDYDVLSHDDQSISMQLRGETRLSGDGSLVIWVLRLTQTPDGYCWGRRDWPLLRCQHPTIRCKDAPLSS